MKAVLGGRRYDTEAKYTRHISTYRYGRALHRFEEQLHRTGHGQWFLACRGEAMSRHARRVTAGEWASGERIIPITKEQAEKWLAEHDQELVAEFFGSEQPGA